MSLMEQRIKSLLILQGCHQRKTSYTGTDLYHLVQWAQLKFRLDARRVDLHTKRIYSKYSASVNRISHTFPSDVCFSAI